MNKCIFMGRLTRDPEIRYTQSEKPVAVINYTLAVDRRYKREGEPSADFINFVAYGAAAEFAEKYFKKRHKVSSSRTLPNENIHKQRGQESLCYGIYRRGSRVRGKQEGSRRRTGNGKRRFYADAGRRRITV